MFRSRLSTTLSGVGGAELVAPAMSMKTNATMSRMKTSIAVNAPAMDKKKVFMSTQTPCDAIRGVEVELCRLSIKM